MKTLLEGKKFLTLGKGLAGFAGMLLILLCAFSCSNLMVNDGGSLIISTPGARAATASSFTIKLIGSNGATQNETVSGGSTVQFDNLAPDTYTISVEGKNKDGVLVYSGTKSATVTAGETSSVIVELEKLVGSLTVDFSESVTSSATEFKVELNIGDTLFKGKQVPGVTSVQFDDLAPDTYNIVVEGMDDSGAVVLYGTDSATVEAGKTASADVDLVGVVNDLSSLQQAVTAGGIVYIGSDIDVTSSLTVNTDVTLLPFENDVTLKKTADFELISVSEAVTLTVGGNDYTITLDGDSVTNSNTKSLINANGKGSTVYLNKNSIITNNSGTGLTIKGTNASNKAYLYLNGGTISNNKAGGVSLQYVEFVMNDGSIESNTSTQGAGVNMTTSNTSFVMKGGNISNNNSTGTGGGINVTSGSSFTMEGGSIKGNSATGNGKGVNFAGSGFLKMSGSAVIDSSNEVYLSTNCKITITGKLTGAPSVATITPKEYSSSIQVLSTENGVDLTAMVEKFAVTPNPADGSEWTINTSGNLQQVTQ